jgi:uncharacterized protein YeaO (DUF488 family)
MGLRLRSVQLGSPKKRGEGLRLGTVRYLPRGVKKEDYARLHHFDVWVPTLAPSSALLQQFKKQRLAVETFFRRYRKEMETTDASQLIQLLALLAKKTPISVGCYCDDESRCHRSVLLQLISEAQSEAQKGR